MFNSKCGLFNFNKKLVTVVVPNELLELYRDAAIAAGFKYKFSTKSHGMWTLELEEVGKDHKPFWDKVKELKSKYGLTD